MEKVIRETTDYILQTGPTVEDDTNKTVYQLINKVYDVIEVETNLLPQAYEYLDQLQAGLDARRDEEAMVNEKVDASVIKMPH